MLLRAEICQGRWLITQKTKAGGDSHLKTLERKSERAHKTAWILGGDRKDP